MTIARKSARRATLALAGLVGAATLAVSAAGHSAQAADATDIRESWSVTGDQFAGGTVILNFTLTNIGTTDFVPNSLYNGELRPRAAFAEVVIPVGLKRKTAQPLPTVDNPLIICEAYRGTHGGLTQSNYSDICRVWFYGTIPAGGSITAVIPARVEGGEGDYTAWGGAEVYPPNYAAPVPLNGNLWMPVTFHAGPAPAKPAGGGGTGTALPDLQTTAKASTGSPALGSTFSVLFTVKNAGKGQADASTFTATVPAGLTVTMALDSYSVCGGPTPVSGLTACSIVTDPISGVTTVTFSVPYLATGSGLTTRDVTVYATATARGTSTVSGTFSTVGDVNPANNTASVGITVK